MHKQLLNVWCLLAVFVVSHKTVGAEETLSSYLWTQTAQLQQDALNSVFVQGIKNASLDPSDFGGYMVQDSIYMYMSKISVDIALNKTKDLDLQNFLQHTSDSYGRIYIDMFKQWHIEYPNGVNLTDAFSKYVNLLTGVANNQDPIDLVAAFIPCVKLWPWIGEQISADTGNFGVYTKWVRENFDPSYKGFQVYEKIIDDAFRNGTIAKDKALDLYQKSMKGEVDVFMFM